MMLLRAVKVKALEDEAVTVEVVREGRNKNYKKVLIARVVIYIYKHWSESML